MHAVDTIGVVSKHRWASVEEQRKRLEDDGCRVIIDLAKVDREFLLTAVRDRTVVKVLYAFLLAKGRDSARALMADYKAFSERLAKLPRGCSGYIKDVDTGLVADTTGTRRAMLALVKHQIARHRQGAKSAEIGKRGREALVLNDLQKARGEAIWRNVRKFPTWDDVEPELEKQVDKRMTRWRAHREWGPRIGAKRTET
jgi:hypothetical protein